MRLPHNCPLALAPRHRGSGRLRPEAVIGRQSYQVQLSGIDQRRLCKQFRTSIGVVLLLFRSRAFASSISGFSTDATATLMTGEDMPLFCPSCSAELRSEIIPSSCWKCGAAFGTDQASAPVRTRPPRQRQAPLPAASPVLTAPKPVPGKTPASGPAPIRAIRPVPAAQPSGLAKTMIAAPLFIIAAMLLFVAVLMRDRAVGVVVVPGLIALALGFTAALTKRKGILTAVMYVGGTLIVLIALALYGAPSIGGSR